MNRIELEDFLGYSYLSSLSAGEDGVFFRVSRASKDRKSYESNFYTLRSGSARALTTDGKAGFGVPYRGRFYFLAKRSDEERKSSNTSTIYSLPLDGGEAEAYLTVDGKISRFIPFAENSFVALFSVDRRLEGLEKDEWKTRSEEEENWEDIEERGFYLNGEGYINGRRTRLAVIRNGRTEFVFSDDFSLRNFSLSSDRTRLLALGGVRKGAKEDFRTEVRVVDLSSLSWYTALPPETLTLHGAWFIGDSIIAAGKDGMTYGLNENCDFYIIRNGRAELLKKWGESLSSSVGSDVRYGGGESAFSDGSWLYFTTTLDHSSYLYRINVRGRIEKVVTDEGSVDSAAVYKGNVYYIALRGQKLQELYSKKDGQLTFFNEKVLSDRYVPVPEEIGYENDGLKFRGWVLRPFGYTRGVKYPAILDIHGGPKTVYGTVFVNEMMYWAGQGYFVFWTNPRGSDGRGNEFADIRGKYGTVDYSDLMKFTDTVLEKYHDIDPGRVGVTGGSYGGFMSNWILGHTKRFRAVATQRSIYNWVSFLGTSDIGPRFAPDQCGCSYYDTESLYHRSPMEGIIRNASTPTLILHSDKDYRCPVEQAYQLYSTLVEKGVETKFVLFHDETHELSRSGKPLSRLKRLREITLWMDRHLKK